MLIGCAGTDEKVRAEHPHKIYDHYSITCDEFGENCYISYVRESRIRKINIKCDAMYQNCVVISQEKK